jgi:hypothetical protein
MKNFFAWFFSIFFFISGLANIFTMCILPGLSIIVIGLIINPKFVKFIENKINFQLTIINKIILGMIFFICTGENIIIFITSIIISGIYLIYVKNKDKWKGHIKIKKEKMIAQKEIEMEIKNEHIRLEMEKMELKKEIEMEIKNEKNRIEMEKEKIEKEIEKEKIRIEMEKEKQEKLNALNIKLNKGEITQEIFDNIKQKLGL